MMILQVFTIVLLLLSIAMIITAEYKFERHVEKLMCEVLKAVYNMEQVKEQAKNAAKRGEEYIEI